MCARRCRQSDITAAAAVRLLPQSRNIEKKITEVRPQVPRRKLGDSPIVTVVARILRLGFREPRA